MSKIHRAILLILGLIACFPAITFPCSGFYYAADSTIFAAKNQDFFNPGTKVWFVPSGEGGYGRVYFGSDDYYPVGGMNERGLVMDHFQGPDQVIRNSADRPVYNGNLFDKIMAECATIGDVETVLGQWNLRMFHNGMVMFGDSYGDSMIVEGDVIIRKSGTYQVCTNFYQSEYPSGAFLCDRYNTADRMIVETRDMTWERSRDILSAVHQDITQYSVIYDITRGIIHLSHFHGYSRFVTLTLNEELQKGAHEYDIPALFPANDDFRTTYHSKLTPRNSVTILLFLVCCWLAYFATIVFWPSAYMIRRQETQENGVTALALSLNRSLMFRLAASIVSLLGAIYIFALTKFTQVFTFGLPRSLDGHPPIEIILVHIPFIMAIFSIPMSIGSIVAWKASLWNRFGRIHYTVLTLLTIALLSLFAYWNLIRVYL